jgi:hypothetical protein
MLAQMKKSYGRGGGLGGAGEEEGEEEEFGGHDGQRVALGRQVGDLPYWVTWSVMVRVLKSSTRSAGRG